MKRSKRLLVVLDLAERKRKQAEQLLGQAQSRVQQGEATLTQLQEYYSDYGNSFYGEGSTGVTPGQLLTHQAFMQKLRTAVEQQKNALVMDREQLKKVEEYWQTAYRHFKSVDSLVEKLKHKELLQEEKQQQKELDERSQLIRPPFI